MYINDVNILIYIGALFLGAIVGAFINWFNAKIIKGKKIALKDMWNDLRRKKLDPNYIVILINAVLYLMLIYRFGIGNGIMENLELIKYMVLIPMLISVIMIDYQKKIIPNRVTLTIFEAGIIFTFIYATNNLFEARDSLFAAVIGAAIFGAIALLGKLIAGKDVLGMGDVKLVAALGLYFGIPLTLSISVISFVLAAIVSIVLLIAKKKKSTDYITFGPCICAAALLCIMIPESTMITALLTVFTLGKYKV